MPSTSFSFNEELKIRTEKCLKGNQSLSQFAAVAMEEKVSRMETRDKRSRRQLLMSDFRRLMEVIADNKDEFREAIR